MFILDKATIIDAPEIKKLLFETWSSAYANILTPQEIAAVTNEWHGIELLQRQITSPDSIFIVARKNGKIVAMCNAEIEQKRIYIQRIHVLPSFQRQGIGSKLLSRIIISIPDASAVHLEVEKQNIPAYNFYLKQGFTKIGEKTFTVASVTLYTYQMEKKFRSAQTIA